MNLRTLLGELRVLVVDDEEDVRRGLERLVRGTGARADTAASAEEALAHLETAPADLVVTDVRMEGASGVELLRQIRRRWPDTEVVLLTGFGTIETAVTCLQAGAAHFLTKPFDNDQLLEVVERVGLKALAARRGRDGGAEPGPARLIAVDARMRDVMDQVERIAPLAVPVLLQGRSGTGKELVARALHARGRHPDRPFLSVNCAAFPDPLLEDELFGHVRGAFPGAEHDRAGLLVKAGGGTVFLDEVASLSLPVQGRLLRVLEERRVRPLGGLLDVPVEARIVAASHRDLPALIERGQFREDLYYRLRVMTIRLPTLAERPADLPALAAHFAERAARQLLGSEAPVPALSPAALEELAAHDWPGNVRELENVLQQAVVAAGPGPIQPHHLRLGTTLAVEPEEGLTYDEGKQRAIQRFQRRFVLAALARTGGNVTRAAAACGLTRAALQRIMRDLGIEREAFTARAAGEAGPPGSPGAPAAS